jgi:DNA repair protein RecN (Recombination protein N)
MLCELRIRNFAIIDDLTLSFGSGLNAITGETGAGKSIILQALGLLCGARGGTDLIRGEADDASIEGLFECALPAELRESLGVDGEEVLIRRQLSRSGKSRSHVNGSPVTLALLAEIGSLLVHIYGQHEQASLLRPASHLDLLDTFAGVADQRAAVAAAHRAYREAHARLEALERDRATAAARRELIEFQCAELLDAAVIPGEENELRRERELLRHAERVHEVCQHGEAMLYSGHDATVSALTRLGAQLAELTGVAPGVAEIAELIEAGRVQLEEAALQLRAIAERLHADPERLDAVEARLQLLSRLTRKHGVTADALPALAADLDSQRAALESEAEAVEQSRSAVARQHAAALALAQALSSTRQDAARQLEARMETELSALGMREAVFRVAHTTDPGGLDRTGIDAIEFLLSANPGEAARPLARIASGGELSRIMLALKALTASVGEAPILIFDEVDAGIGGAVADAVARRLHLLAQNRQLLCITHLPQIAAYADHHYAVEKHQRNGRTITDARPLGAAERIAEISRMLGGGAAPAEAERYARRLLAEARRSATHP